MKRQRREFLRLSRNRGLMGMSDGEMLTTFYSRHWDSLPESENGRKFTINFFRIRPKGRGKRTVGVYFEYSDAQNHKGYRHLYLPRSMFSSPYWIEERTLGTFIHVHVWRQSPEEHIKDLLEEQHPLRRGKFGVDTISWASAKHSFRERHDRLLRVFMFYGLILPHIFYPGELQ